MEATPIYDDLVKAFRLMRRSSRLGGRCIWIEAYAGASYEKCLTCGDLNLEW